MESFRSFFRSVCLALLCLYTYIHIISHTAYPTGRPGLLVGFSTWSVGPPPLPPFFFSASMRMGMAMHCVALRCVALGERGIILRRIGLGWIGSSRFGRSVGRVLDRGFEAIVESSQVKSSLGRYTARLASKERQCSPPPFFLGERRESLTRETGCLFFCHLFFFFFWKAFETKHTFHAVQYAITGIYFFSWPDHDTARLRRILICACTRDLSTTGN